MQEHSTMEVAEVMGVASGGFIAGPLAAASPAAAAAAATASPRAAREEDGVERWQLGVCHLQATFGDLLRVNGDVAGFVECVAASDASAAATVEAWVTVVATGDPDVVAHAVRGLAVAAAAGDTHWKAALVAGGALPALARALTSVETATHENVTGVARAIASLAEDRAVLASEAAAFQRLVPVMERILAGAAPEDACALHAARTLSLFAAMYPGELGDAVATRSVLTSLTKALGAARPGSEVGREVLTALERASALASVEDLLAANVLPVAVNVLAANAGFSHGQGEACSAVHVLGAAVARRVGTAEREAIRRALQDAEAVSTLVRILQEGSVRESPVADAAGQALGRLCMLSAEDSEAWMAAIMAGGVVSALVKALSSTLVDYSDDRHLTRALLHLTTLSKAAAEATVREGGWHVLAAAIYLPYSPSESKEFATRALMNIDRWNVGPTAGCAPAALVDVLPLIVVNLTTAPWDSHIARCAARDLGAIACDAIARGDGALFGKFMSSGSVQILGRMRDDPRVVATETSCGVNERGAASESGELDVVSISAQVLDTIFSGILHCDRDMEMLRLTVDKLVKSIEEEEPWSDTIGYAAAALSSFARASASGMAEVATLRTAQALTTKLLVMPILTDPKPRSLLPPPCPSSATSVAAAITTIAGGPGKAKEVVVSAGAIPALVDMVHRASAGWYLCEEVLRAFSILATATSVDVREALVPAAQSTFHVLVGAPMQSDVVEGFAASLDSIEDKADAFRQAFVSEIARRVNDGLAGSGSPSRESSVRQENAFLALARIADGPNTFKKMLVSADAILVAVQAVAYRPVVAISAARILRRVASGSHALREAVVCAGAVPALAAAVRSAAAGSDLVVQLARALRGIVADSDEWGGVMEVRDAIEIARLYP